ncbi:nuclear transport factor 2 family protein [Enemella sp. A6]|uniref:nuclear transport factor 2 family protein n=1 Tax=Enemella sp. A6 TaxID=3440152 RepID=UPI003EBD023F
MTEQLEKQIAALEARHEIEQLKYRYLRACDAKDPQAFRDCFVPEGADLDYGPLGKFDTVDDLVAIYERIALAKGEDGYFILDMHHAMHPSIDIISETEAVGQWTLRFRQVNLHDRTERLTCGNYDDSYVKVDGQWRIRKHHFHALWSVARPLPEGASVMQLGWGE